jgi:hypothetical protein
MRACLRLLFPFAMVLAFWNYQVEAFTTSSLIYSTCRASSSSECSSTVLREGNNLFDKFKSFWDGMGNSGKNDPNESIENEDAAAGTSRIVTIPGTYVFLGSRPNQNLGYGLHIFSHYIFPISESD